jgi:hypothetical protein
MSTKKQPTHQVDQAAGLPAPVPMHGRLVPKPDSHLPDCPTNLDLTLPEHKVLLFNALNPGDLDLAMDGQIEILATHYLVYPDEGTDPETGEVHQFARTVLITRDGRTFRTTAAHGPHRIAAALDLFADSDWARGIRFQVSERKSRRTGRTYHDIRILGVGDG